MLLKMERKKINLKDKVKHPNLEKPFHQRQHQLHKKYQSHKNN